MEDISYKVITTVILCVILRESDSRSLKEKLLPRLNLRNGPSSIVVVDMGEEPVAAAVNWAEDDHRGGAWRSEQVYWLSLIGGKDLEEICHWQMPPLRVRQGF